MAVGKKLMTVEEFERFADAPENADRRFELIDGEIVELSPTELHGLIVVIISSGIFVYLQQNPIGRVTVETRHRMPDDRHNARIPDVSFTSNERLLALVEKGSVPQMPDLAVEVKSPDDSLKGLREKAAYYLANGSRMVWLVQPEKRLIDVYVQDGDIQVLTERDTLEGGDVLPGFSLAVRAVFPQ
jgi:Uma2 family endonuclease